VGRTLDYGAVNITGGGYGLIQLALNGTIPVLVMVILAGGKILATSFTISSGGSGGVFAPSLVLGALVGGVVGSVAHDLGLVRHTAPFVLVGMAGLFGGVARVPVTGVIMISEINRSYGLLAPSMLVCTISFLLTRRWTLYEEQVPTRIDSAAHRGDFVADFLQEIRVAEVMHTEELPPFLRAGTPLRDVMRLLADSVYETFPVVDRAGEIVGVVTLAEVRRVMTDQDIWDLVVVEEVVQEDVEPVRPSCDLHTALRRLTRGSVDELPVVAEEDPTRIVGMVTRRDVIAAYDRLVEEAQERRRR
jgi:CIC family chloride channel protein